MLNLNDLYFFTQVVEQKGFAAAARALGLPKSSLSKRVAELERSLGIRLIQRTSRSFRVTEAGEDLYRRAAAIVSEAEAAELAVRERLAEPQGTVRVTASSATAQMWLSELLAEFALLYPKVRVVFHATDRFVDLVQEGFDVAIRAHAKALPDSDLISHRIGFTPNVLVAAPRYLAERPQPSSPADLQDHDGVFAASAGTAPSWILEQSNGEVRTAQAKPRFFADEPMTLMNAALAGLGIASLPYGLMGPHLDAGRLSRVLPEWRAGGATTTILTPYRRGQLPSVRAVVDFLATRLAAWMKAIRA